MKNFSSNLRNTKNSQGLSLDFLRENRWINNENETIQYVYCKLHYILLIHKMLDIFVFNPFGKLSPYLEYFNDQYKEIND